MQKPLIKKYSIESNLSFSAGVLAALLGGIALSGWHWNLPLLIQVHPAFTAMKYNAALLIFLMGLSLVLLNMGFRRIPGLAGIFIALASGLTLCEYAFDLDLGVDQLFTKDYLDPESRYPGRMAVNAAIGFSLMGCSLGILGLSWTQAKCKYCAVGILGSMAMAIGLVALLGHLAGLPSTYRWGMSSNMDIAQAASLGLVVAGAGAVCLAWARDDEKVNGLPSWFHILLFVGMGTISLCMGLALIANEYELLKNQMGGTESELATRTFLPETILVLGLLASVLLGTSAYYARRANARAGQLDIAYKKLKSSEELLDVVVKHLPVGIFMADIEGKSTYLNEYGCSLIGVKREDVIGDGWTRYVHPDDLPDLLAKWQEAVRRLTEFHHEFRLQASDKVKLANRFYVHAIPLKNMAGEVTGFAGTLIETTQIKEIETALKNSHEQMEKAQSFSKVMVCHVGLDGTWLKVPPTLSELLGYSESELIGKPFKDVTHPEDFLSAWSQCERLIGGEIKSFELEKRCLRKDWSIVWFYINYSIVEDAHGKPLHFLAYIINIDDKKRFDELEVSRDKLRQLAVGIQSAQEDERTRIAREIHDDLGQALTLTRLGLAHIEERAVLLEPELSRNFKKLFKLIDDTMFAMRRIISGLRPPVLDDFGLPAAIDWHVGEFQAQTGIECELHLEVAESQMSAEKELTLFRIYQEAMTNIVRHAKAAKVVIVLRRQGGILELEINDDGCGIPQTNIYRGKSSGILGMYERASLWGWELKVQGKPKEGTVVLVRMPILKDESPANIRDIINP